MFGKVAYEVVDSNFNLPCNKYLVILTSKKQSKYLLLESIGIEPDVKFEIDKDWIVQVQTYIAEKI